MKQAQISGKRVFVRAGFDVPMENGHVTDESRIHAVVPTLTYILENGGSIVIAAHQDRPKGKIVPEFSQKPLVPILQKALGTSVRFAESCVGDATQKLCAALKPGDVVLLENLRFDEREEKNDEKFASELASLADMYVNEAFTNCHREHASMVAVAKLLPAFMGLQLEEEVTHLSRAIHRPKRPLTLIISGAKIETKLPVIQHFMETGDDVLVGGAIANTFMAASGFGIGTSLQEVKFHGTAKNLMNEHAAPDAASIHLLTDAVSARDMDQSGVVRAMEEIPADESIFDVGPNTAAAYAAIIAQSGTVVWNGPLGAYEHEQFASASKTIAAAVKKASQNGAVTIIGGGDTLDFHVRYGIDMSAYTFVSTGGGAMLEFISGKPLPALEVLRQNP